MSELRKDVVKQKWVAIAAGRALKPNDFPIARREVGCSKNPGFCPFCEGNEEFTPPEIAAFRPGGQEANTPGWLIRSIPNKFSAFSLEGELEESRKGIYRTYNGLGQHEVLVETPEHGTEFHELSVERIEMIIGLLKQRYNDLSMDKRIKYIQVYKNRGMFAGASLEHSHSQIVGLPMVPSENNGLSEYYRENGSCFICDLIEQEIRDKERLIYEGEHFIIVSPYASRFSYESWIVPKRHCEHFGQINEQEIKELADISRKFTMALLEGFGNPSYNFIINTAPVNVHTESAFHWYMEITPRLLVNAGVELATGVFINPVAPELAAQMLKESLLNFL